jgi:hypothetical protein
VPFLSGGGQKRNVRRAGGRALRARRPRGNTAVPPAPPRRPGGVLTYQTVTRQILINGPDAGPIKVAYEGDPRQAQCVLGRHHSEEVGVVFNCVNGVCVRIGDLQDVGRRSCGRVCGGGAFSVFRFEFSVSLCSRQVGLVPPPMRVAGLEAGGKTGPALVQTIVAHSRGALLCAANAPPDTHLDQVEEVGGLGDRVRADPARVAVEQHLLGLLVDHVEELLEAYGGVALVPGAVVFRFR